MNKIHLIIRSFCLFLTLCGSVSMSAQVDLEKKNTLYATFGSVIFSGQGSISYERVLLNSRALQTRGRVMLGNYFFNEYDYVTGARKNEKYLALSVVEMIHFVEISAGLAYGTYTLDAGFSPLPGVDYSEVFTGFSFIGGLGVRFEFNDIMIRAGVSNLELLYIGGGFNF